MKKETENKKQMTLAVMAVLVLVLMVVGVSYAVFNWSKAGVKENSITTGTLVFTYTENTNGITINNAHPLSDATGKALSDTNKGTGTGVDPAKVTQPYFDFTVGATIAGTATIDYEVYLEKVSGDLDDYAKIYLTDQTADTTCITADHTSDTTVPVYSQLSAGTVSGTKKLYTGSFSETGEKKFRLRMWLSNNYDMSYHPDDTTDGAVTTMPASKSFTVQVQVDAKSDPAYNNNRPTS